jgi:hypothetical protein
VEWSEAVQQTRTWKQPCRLPEKPKRGLYYSWIQTNTNTGNLFYTDWILWDLDTGTVEELYRILKTVVSKMRALGVPNECLRVVFTSNRGFHLYLDSRIVNLQPSHRLHNELKSFCLSVIPTADVTLYDKRHIIGLPNSVHKGTGKRYTMVCADEFLSGTLSALQARTTEQFAIEPRAIAVKPIDLFVRKFGEQATSAGKITLGATRDLPSVDTRSTNALRGAKEGGRNAAMFEVARIGKVKGLTFEETIVFVRGANLQNKPPLSDDEIRKIVGSAFSG